MRRPLLIGAVTLLAGVLGGLAWAWPILRILPNPFATIDAVAIGEGVYLLQGGAANAGFVVGDGGVVAIDAQLFVPTARNALKAIAAVTPKPVTHVILTHADPDHVNGLPAFPKGVTVIAHRNAVVRMRAALAAPSRRLTAPPAELKDYLPADPPEMPEEMVVEGVEIRLLHVGPAHTDGDLVIYLPRQKIVFAGDILTPSVSPYPGLHLEKGGSSAGWIETVRAMIRLDADRYVSGHGAILDAAELRRRLDEAVARRDAIAAMVAKGLTLPEIKAALNDPSPVGEAALFPTFTETTYQELTQRK